MKNKAATDSQADRRFRRAERAATKQEYSTLRRIFRELRRARIDEALRVATHSAIRPELRAPWSAAIIFAALIRVAGPWAVNTRAQGSRKDDVVFNSWGQPLAGATVRVCTASATPTAAAYNVRVSQ